MKRVLFVTLIFFYCMSSVFADRIGVLVEEEDGSPAGYAVKLKVSNGTLALSGSTGTITVGGGSGDVTGVGDCISGACLDGTSDGGTYARLYDGDSNYVQIDVGDLSGDITVNMPASAGTLQLTPTEGAFVDGDKTKLDGIEAVADVTDATNVAAAGALMASTYDTGPNNKVDDTDAVSLTDTSDTGATWYPWMSSTATGTQAGQTDAGLYYDAVNNVLYSAGGFDSASSDNPTQTFDETDGTDWQIRVDDTGNSFEIGSSQGGIGDNVELEIDEDGDLHVTGDVYTNAGSVPVCPNITVNTKSAAYTVGTDDICECYGGIIYVTSAATITACDNLEAHMGFSIVTIGAIAVNADVQSDDLQILDGVTLDDGDQATNTSTISDTIVFQYYDSTGWYTMSGSPDGDHWTDGS